MMPTAHFRQHHDVEPPRIDASTFRPAWRVRTRLDRLLADGAITPAEWHCAVYLRSMLELTASGPRTVRTQFLPSGRSNLEIHSRALGHCRQAAQAVGAICYGFLLACLVEDLSWAGLGRRLGVDPRTARSWVIAAIKLLIVAQKKA